VLNENFRRTRSIVGNGTDDAAYQLEPNPLAGLLKIGDVVMLNYASSLLRKKAEPGTIVGILDGERAHVVWPKSGPAEIDLRFLIKK
jgi:hypothetical protein